MFFQQLAYLFEGVARKPEMTQLLLYETTVNHLVLNTAQSHHGHSTLSMYTYNVNIIIMMCHIQDAAVITLMQQGMRL